MRKKNDGEQESLLQKNGIEKRLLGLQCVCVRERRALAVSQIGCVYLAVWVMSTDMSTNDSDATGNTTKYLVVRQNLCFMYF